MTTDRKMPEQHYYIVPHDVTPEKLVHILYTNVSWLGICENIVDKLLIWNRCYVVNKDDCYCWVKSALEVPPEYKQWFPTTIGEL